MREKNLIEKCLHGDEDSFKILMQSYEQRIFFACLQIVKDEQLAHDLTQETFLHAYQHLSSFRQESSFYTWIYRIGRNLSLNALKKIKNPTQEYREDLHASKFSLPEKHSEEFDQLIQEGLKTLPFKQRQVFELFDLQNFSHKEIAAKLNIPPGTVRSRLYYARKKMQEFLKGRLPEGH